MLMRSAPRLVAILMLAAPAARAADAPDLAAPPPAAAPAAAPPGALTLAEAEATAIHNQPAMVTARGQSDAAQGRVEQARAGYLPQASLALSYSRTTNNFAPSPGQLPSTTTMMLQNQQTSYSGKTFNFYAGSLTASQLIYDFGQTNHRWDAAESNRDAARWSEQSTSAQVLLNVRRAYFQARAQRDLVDVAAETVRNQEKHLNQIQAFVSTGIRPEIDLAQARTAVANANVQLVGAQNNYAVSMAQLDQAMGVAAGTTRALADSDLPPVPGEDGSSEALVSEALKARPELAVLAKQREAQEQTVRSLEGSYGPALSATAGTSYRAPDFETRGINWQVGVALSWAFLQGGLTRGQVHEARGNLVAATGQEETEKLQVRVEVEQSRLGVAAAKSSITAADEALVNAREQLRLAEARYANGLGSVIELGDAQVAYSSAEAQEVQARFGLASARAQLITSLGTR
jgi:outer membrane protein